MISDAGHHWSSDLWTFHSGRLRNLSPNVGAVTAPPSAGRYCPTIELMEDAVLTNEMFADLGKTSIAYLKPQSSAGDTVTYAIHAADGMFLAECAHRDVAAAIVRSHDMEAVSVH